MSSQGPASAYTAPTGTYGPKSYTVASYTFNSSTIRDSSGWTEFLRQKRIAQEGPVGNSLPNDPWIPYGQDRRLDFLNGRFKLAGFGCTGCTGSAFIGDGNPYS